MDKTQEKLKEETEKWLEKLEDKLEKTKNEHEQMENVHAYRKDTYHFLEEKDFIRAWESVVYAWGILETLGRLEIIENGEEEI